MIRNTLLTLAPVMAVVALGSLPGCVAEAEAPGCRCQLETDSGIYNLPCDVQACIGGVGVVCVSTEEVDWIDIWCGDDESAFEEGVCTGEARGCYTSTGGATGADCPLHCDVDCWNGFCRCMEKSPPERCEDQRGELGCENVNGCNWRPAACTHSDNGCEAWEVTVASEE